MKGLASRLDSRRERDKLAVCGVRRFFVACGDNA